MTCPNCGLENPPGARFCGNCGTSFTGGPTPPPPPPNQQYNPMGNQYNQSSQPYNMSSGWNNSGQRMSFGRSVGLGCLFLVVLFFLAFFSCTARGCFRSRRYYRYMRYSQVHLVKPQPFPIIQA